MARVSTCVDADGTKTVKDVSESEEMFVLILERNFKYFSQGNGPRSPRYTYLSMPGWATTAKEKQVRQY